MSDFLIESKKISLEIFQLIELFFEGSNN
jgi:hypothetical protein